MTFGGWENGVTSRVIIENSGPEHGWRLVPLTLPDGRAVLFGIGDAVIRRWDPIDGSEVGPPIFGAQRIWQAAAFVDNARQVWLIVTYRAHEGPSTGIHFLDAATGLESRPPVTAPQLVDPLDTYPVTMPDGRALVAVGFSVVLPDGWRIQATQLWDPETGKPVGPANQTVVRGSAVIDGRPVLLGTGSGEVLLWDVAGIVGGAWTAQRLPVEELSSEAEAEPIVVPSNAGTGIAVGTGRTVQEGVTGAHRVALLDLQTRQPVVSPVEVPDPVHNIRRLPLPDGPGLLAVGDSTGTMRLFTADTLAPVGQPHAAHLNGFRSLVAIRVGDGRVLLATSGFDDTVRVWEPVKPPPTTVTLTGHDGPVLALTPTTLPDGRTLLASGGRDKTLRLWDPITATPVGTPLTGHTGPVLALTSTPNILLSGSGDTTVRRWNPTTATPTGTALTGHRGPVGALTTLLLPDGHTLIISAGADATLLRWDATTGAPVGPPLTGHTGAVHAAITLGSPLVATAGDDTTVRLWNLTTGTLVATLTGHTGPVRALTTVHLSDGTTLLASAGDDTTVRLWNPTTATPVGTPLTGHTGPVRALTTLPRPHGPTLLASTGDDRSLRLWDPTTGTPAGDPLTGPTDTVRAAATITVPGGRTLLATAGDDATLTLWTIP